MAFKKDKRDSPLRVYAVAGNLTWIIITPLLLFIGGGSWVVNRFFAESQWLMVPLIFIGLSVMVASVWNYIKQIMKMYGGESKATETAKKPEPVKQERKDYDY